MRRVAALLLALTTLAAGAGTATATVCPNESSPGFRSYLPDCRAYELVTPPYKEGFLTVPTGISRDGLHILVQSFGAFAGTKDVSALPQPYDLRRGEDTAEPGWQPNALSTPFAEHPTYALETITPRFETGLWAAATTTTPNGEEGPLREAFFLGSTSDPAPWQEVGPGEPPGGGGLALRPVGASEDLSHSVYVVTSPNPGSTSHLWPGDTTAPGGAPSLYEYAGLHNPEPRLVGISDEGAPASIAASHLISDCGIDLGSAGGDAYNAVSSTGSYVFFTARAQSNACSAPAPAVNEIYARIDGQHTIPISEPSESTCKLCELSAPADAEFAGASADGAHVFFTTTQNLLAGASGTAENLYEYSSGAPPGAHVTRISGGASPGNGEVLGVARVSEDASHVYYVAAGVLAGANRAGNTPTQGAPNLYLAVKTCPASEPSCPSPAVHTTFIATLSSEDSADWRPEDARPVQATPDGDAIVFQSVADLTPDQQGYGHEAGQIFEYDAPSETLVRVSRGEGGFDDDGNSEQDAATIPTQGHTQDLPMQRYSNLALSADGSRVFFSTADALTPVALPGATNVYEFHDGQIGLITDGHDASRSEGFPVVSLIGTDEAGLDAFFTTADQLVPQDTDDQVDLYDARSDGGFPPEPQLAPCSPDACQGPLVSPRPTIAAATETQPAGEQVPPPPPVKPPLKTASQIRAQKLASALRACRREPKRRRARCQAVARRRFGRAVRVHASSGGHR